MSEQTPLVSIVTPSYNQGQYIERTILSVLRQDYPRIEYILLDSLSTDETGQILDRYQNEISILVREKDKGQADAINTGLKRASGQILAYLNADDCLASASVVTKAVEALLSDSKPDAVYGRRYYIDPAGYYLHSYPFRDFDSELNHRVNVIPQECCFWTREIYEKSGGYANADYHFAMDYEMWLRFLAHGARIEAVEPVFGLFRVQENQKSNVIWRNVGLPEIAKLQQQYGGKASKVFDMEVLHESYYYNVDRVAHTKEYELAKKLWETQVRLTRESLASTPVDHWVFQQQKAQNGHKYSLTQVR